LPLVRMPSCPGGSKAQGRRGGPQEEDSCVERVLVRIPKDLPRPWVAYRNHPCQSRFTFTLHSCFWLSTSFSWETLSEVTMDVSGPQGRRRRRVEGGPYPHCVGVTHHHVPPASPGPSKQRLFSCRKLPEYHPALPEVGAGQLVVEQDGRNSVLLAEGSSLLIECCHQRIFSHCPPSSHSGTSS